MTRAIPLTVKLQAGSLITTEGRYLPTRFALTMTVSAYIFNFILCIYELQTVHYVYNQVPRSCASRI